MLYGYAGAILRVDLSNADACKEPLPDSLVDQIVAKTDGVRWPNKVHSETKKERPVRLNIAVKLVK